MNTNFSKVASLSAILVVAAGAVGWRLALSRTRGSAAVPAAEAAGNGDELAALRRQVQALQDEQSRTRYKVDVALKAPGAKEEASKDDAEPVTSEELKKRDYERSKHVADYVQRIMDDESTDLTWAPSRVQEIRESFKEFKLPGFTLKDADCRSTLCRVTVERGADAVTQELGGAIVQLEPFKKMGVFFHYEDDRVVMYAPREGHDFPKDPALARR